MKKLLFSIFAFSLLSNVNAQITILAARTSAIATSVSIKGVALNGAELGIIRYISDGTAAIPVYGALTSSVNRGDSVAVTGVVKDFKCLLELDPISSLTVINSNNTIAPPFVITPNQYGETYEGQLIKFSNVTFKKTGNFAGNTNYTIVGATLSDSAVVRVSNGTNLIGTPIPTGIVDIIGLGSQFSNSTTCTSGYQVLLRDLNDVIPTASVYLTQDLKQQNITQSGFDVTWETNIAGSNSFVKIGNAPSNYTQTYTSNNATLHTYTFSGLSAASIYYVKVFTVNGLDTAVSGEKVFATASFSSGVIKCYFNKTVDTTVAFTNNNAIATINAIDDTIVAHINRAVNTLDIAIYNWDASSGITTAINNAYTRGVLIRIILDGSTAQIGAQTLNLNVPFGVTPQGINYTIMHNKIMIIDAEDSLKALVTSGSTNWTNNQLNTDANNFITVQDQTLARAYKLEFDEMWGGNVYGSAFNATLAKYGQFKTDNTPHEFLIGGNRVEAYFSPSDGTTQKIIGAINSASDELYTANLVFTRTDIANAIKAKKLSSSSIIMYSILDDTTSSAAAYSILKPALGSNIFEDAFSWSFHHKYLIADQSNALNDPLVLTGSHNWSTAGETKNDENTLIVHNQNIANQYYQEFIMRLKDNGIFPLFTNINNSSLKSIIALVYPNPAKDMITIHAKKGAMLKIFNLQGVLVYQNACASDINNIDVSSFARGLYVLHVYNNGLNATSKIIVE